MHAYTHAKIKEEIAEKKKKEAIILLSKYISSPYY